MVYPHWHIPQLESIRTFSVGSAALSVLGAIGHSDVLTWTGAALAVFGATVSTLVAAYHKVKTAQRAEQTADRVALEAQLRVQLKIEELVKRNSEQAEQLAATLAELQKRADTAATAPRETI